MRWWCARWLERLLPGQRLQDTLRETSREAGSSVEGLLAAAVTDRGLVRPNNEDALLCAPERGLYIVADGMGGHAAGEEASATAVATLADALSPERVAQATGADGGFGGLLEEAFQQAQEAVNALNDGHPEWGGRSGSTAVVVLIQDDDLHVANSGDSRAYLVREGRARVVSRDHSLAALLVEQGKLTEADARGHRLRNQLTAFVGMARPVPPAYQRVAVYVGDRVVVCSDGVWDMLPDDEIARLAAEAPDAGAAACALVDAANRAGGHDNATAIVALIPAGREAPPPEVEADTVVMHHAGS
jgi:PPM family protein phosphatase